MGTPELRHPVLHQTDRQTQRQTDSRTQRAKKRTLLVPLILLLLVLLAGGSALAVSLSSSEDNESNAGDEQARFAFPTMSDDNVWTRTTHNYTAVDTPVKTFTLLEKYNTTLHTHHYFEHLLAEAYGVTDSKLEILGVRNGSVVVDFTVVVDAHDDGEESGVSTTTDTPTDPPTDPPTSTPTEPPTPSPTDPPTSTPTSTPCNNATCLANEVCVQDQLCVQAALLLPPTKIDDSNKTWNHTFLLSYLSADDVGTNGTDDTSFWTPEVQYRFQTDGGPVTFAACHDTIVGRGKNTGGITPFWRFPSENNDGVMEDTLKQELTPSSNTVTYENPPGTTEWWYNLNLKYNWKKALDSSLLCGNYNISFQPGTYDVALEYGNDPRYTKRVSEATRVADMRTKIPPVVGTLTLTNAVMLAYETNGTWYNTTR